ncbi:MAG: hypothetical protein EZS28_048050, partial [Streblomastix strix]
ISTEEVKPIEQQPEQIEQQPEPVEQQPEPVEQQPEPVQDVQEEEIIEDDGQYQKGIVEITILGILNIKSTDIDGKSDPYIKVILNNENLRQTKKVKNTLNAEYNETFKFDFDPKLIKERKIKLELWDYDRFSADDLVGQTTIPLSDLTYQKIQKRLQFKGVNNLYNQDVGQIDVIASYIKEGEQQLEVKKKEVKVIKDDEYEEDQEYPQGIVNVYVTQIRELTCEGTGDEGEPQLFIKAILGQKEANSYKVANQYGTADFNQ